MSYQIEIKKSAEREYKNLEKVIKERIKTAILDLGKNPKPSGYKKLQNIDGYRIRVGKYRILYAIDEELKKVDITAIGHRKDVYRKS